MYAQGTVPDAHKMLVDSKYMENLAETDSQTGRKRAVGKGSTKADAEGHQVKRTRFIECQASSGSDRSSASCSSSVVKFIQDTSGSVVEESYDEEIIVVDSDDEQGGVSVLKEIVVIPDEEEYRSFAEEVERGRQISGLKVKTDIVKGFIFPGTSIEVVDVLGRGGFGEVYETNWKGKRNALKLVRNEIPVDQELIDKEVLIFKKIRDLHMHRSLVKCIETFEYGSSFGFLMEKLDIDLHHYMKMCDYDPLPPCIVKIIGKQVFQGLRMLVTLGYLHGDVKPSNILLANRLDMKDPWKVKLADYGNAVEVDELDQISNMQTLNYRCPELLLGLPVDASIDCWSAGATLFFLYAGFDCFNGTAELEMLHQIAKVTGLPPLTFTEPGLKQKFFEQRVKRGLLGHRLKPTKSPMICYMEDGLVKMIEYGYWMKTEQEPKDEDFEMLDLIKKLMKSNPAERINMDEAYELLEQMI